MNQITNLHEALAAVRGGPVAADTPVPQTLAAALAMVRDRRPVTEPKKPAAGNWWDR